MTFIFIYFNVHATEFGSKSKSYQVHLQSCLPDRTMVKQLGGPMLQLVVVVGAWISG